MDEIRVLGQNEPKERKGVEIKGATMPDPSSPQVVGGQVVEGVKIVSKNNPPEKSKSDG